jgi:hypothetical protein
VVKARSSDGLSVIVVPAVLALTAFEKPELWTHSIWTA